MGRTIRFEPRPPDMPPTIEEVHQFIDKFQILVLRRPTAARIIMQHVEVWVAEIVTEDDT